MPLIPTKWQSNVTNTDMVEITTSMHLIYIVIYIITLSILVSSHLTKVSLNTTDNCMYFPSVYTLES